jgi:phosphatidylcholine synthase
MVWLLATQVIDGVDGPMARAWDVKERVPQIDGYVLDLIIDFVTCVVIPAAFLHQFDLLPAGSSSLALVGLVVFTSALWFSRTDMMTSDNWFRGFPAVWNLVAPTLYLLRAPKIVGAVAVIVLSICSLGNVAFPHPVRVERWRNITLPVTVGWLAVMGWLTIVSPTSNLVGRLLLILAPLYFFGLAIVKHRVDAEAGALAI